MIIDHIFYESKLTEMPGCPIGKIQLIANYMPILNCCHTKDILESLQRLANKIADEDDAREVDIARRMREL